MAAGRFSAGDESVKGKFGNILWGGGRLADLKGNALR